MIASRLIVAVLQGLAHRAVFAPTACIPIGLAIPALAEAALPLVPMLVACSVGCGVLLCEPGRLHPRELLAALLIGLANLLLTPLLTLLALTPGVPAAAALVLIAGAPAANSSAIIAAALGLPVRVAVLTQIGTMALAPLSLPLLAALLPGALSLDPLRMFERAALIVLLPAALALLLRRWRPMAVIGSNRALRGMGVLALCGMGVAQTCGLVAGFRGLADGSTLTMLGAAGLVLLAGGVVAGLVGWVARARTGLLGACLGGSRNISLVWASTADQISPIEALALQVALGWTIVVPSLVRLGQWVMGCLAGLASLGSRAGAAATPEPGSDRPRHGRGLQISGVRSI